MQEGDWQMSDWSIWKAERTHAPKESLKQMAEAGVTDLFVDTENTRTMEGLRVTFYLGEMDGKPVVQVDGSGDFRVNVNDAPIWDQRPDAPFIPATDSFQRFDAASTVISTRIRGEQTLDGWDLSSAHLAIQVATNEAGAVIFTGGRDELIELGSRIIQQATIGELRREGDLK
jgi:hypothetical protein